MPSRRNRSGTTDEPTSPVGKRAVLVGVLLLVVIGVAVALTTYAPAALLDPGTEVDADPDPDVIHTSDLNGGGATVVVSVVDEDGNPLEAGTVRVEADGARLHSVQTAALGDGTDAWHEAGGDPGDLAPNEAAFQFADGSGDHAVALGTHENQGDLQITVEPPEDGDYVDEQSNPPIRVIGG